VVVDLDRAGEFCSGMRMSDAAHLLKKTQSRFAGIIQHDPGFAALCNCWGMISLEDAF